MDRAVTSNSESTLGRMWCNQNLCVLLTGMETGVATLASRPAASQQYAMVISYDSMISLLGTGYPPLPVGDKFQGCNGCLKPWQHQTLYPNAFSSSTALFHTVTRMLEVWEMKFSVHFFFENSQTEAELCLLTCLLWGVFMYVCLHAVVTEQLTGNAMRHKSVTGRDGRNLKIL